MELAGTGYLLNLSVLGMTFSTVSALVMLLRQAMGGRMSRFDVFLLERFLFGGFVIALASIIPLLVKLFDASSAATWSIASGFAALLVAWTAVTTPRLRRIASGGVDAPLAFHAYITSFWGSFLILAANSLVPALRGPGPFAAALTLYWATLLWAFVRRIAALMNGSAEADWDPKRG